MTDFYDDTGNAYTNQALMHPSKAKVYVHPSFDDTLAGSYWPDVNENYAHIHGMMTLGKFRAQRRPIIKTYCAGFVSNSLSLLGTDPDAFWDDVIGTGVIREDLAKYQNDGIGGKGGGLQFNTPPWQPLCFPLPSRVNKDTAQDSVTEQEVTISYSLPETYQSLGTNAILEGYEVVLTDRPDLLYTTVHDNPEVGSATWHDEYTYPFFQKFERIPRYPDHAYQFLNESPDSIRTAVLRFDPNLVDFVSLSQKVDRLYLCFLAKCFHRFPSVETKANEVNVNFQTDYTPPARQDQSIRPVGLKSTTTEWGDFAVHGRSGVGYYLAYIEGEGGRYAVYHTMHNSPEFDDSVKQVTGDLAALETSLSGHSLCTWMHPTPPPPKANRGGLRYDGAMRNIEDYKTEESATSIPARFVPLPPISIYSVMVR